MANVSIIYDRFPHYRRAVLRELALSTVHRYKFFGSRVLVDGILPFCGDDVVTVNDVSMAQLPFGLTMLSNYEGAFTPKPDVIILLGNPHIVSTWAMALRARIHGIKVLYWTHGWLKRTPWPKSVVKKSYLMLADGVLTYGQRARRLGIDEGFPRERIHVIWNSLDWEAQSCIFRRLRQVPIASLRARHGLSVGSVVLLTLSRVTEKCRYDWLVAAAREVMVATARRVEIVVVGEGPLLPAMLASAEAEGVSVIALGAIYEEERLAPLIMAADAVVSPGKAGLTVMHALAYGTPVVTHNDASRQMPEAEAVVAGVSGELFGYGDVSGLARAIVRVISWPIEVVERRARCRGMVAGRYTPVAQRKAIDDSITRVAGK